MCCQLEDCYAILTDVPLQTISVFKQLLTTGHSSALGIDTLESLTEFLPDLKLEKTQFCCIPTNDTKMNLMKLGLIVKNLRMYFNNLVENASFDDPPHGRADGSFFKNLQSEFRVLKAL